MKIQRLNTLTMALGFTFAFSAFAAEQAKVISSTPVVEQVSFPQSSCAVVPVLAHEAPTGAGAVLGAIAGGAIGSAVGQGAGNAAATALGVMGGAIVGNNIEASKTSVQNAQQCTTQYTMQSRVTHYNVVYEYAGKQYNVQMPSDPGATLSIEVAPTQAQVPAQIAAASPAYAQPVYTQPVYTQPVYAQPVYVNPYPYYSPFPVGVSIGFGGYYGRGRWR
jgi:uncharacterized protein YcfJ